MKIHENIRSIRKERQMTQEALAEAMGVSCAAVSKWEKGQCVPDLVTLMALADYFEMSVDALLDHRLEGGSLEKQLNGAESAADACDAEEAARLCSQALRFYPNSPEAAERCADIYYQLFIQSGEKSWMEHCIAQTQRLFTLKKGEPESERLSRLRSLANQYELLCQWDKARDYFEQANVGGTEDGNIARCLLGQGNAEEAVTMASDAILNAVFRLSTNVNTLAEAWRTLEKPELGGRATEWICAAMEMLDYSPPLRQVHYMQLSSMRSHCGDREGALAALDKAESLMEEANKAQDVRSGAPFLRCMKPWKLLMTEGKRKEALEICRAALNGEEIEKRSVTFGLTKNLNK